MSFSVKTIFAAALLVGLISTCVGKGSRSLLVDSAAIESVESGFTNGALLRRKVLDDPAPTPSEEGSPAGGSAGGPAEGSPAGGSAGENAEGSPAGGSGD